MLRGWVILLRGQIVLDLFYFNVKLWLCSSFVPYGGRGPYGPCQIYVYVQVHTRAFLDLALYTQDYYINVITY